MTAAVSEATGTLFKSTFWTGAKKVFDFLTGTWTTPIGLEYRNMRQNPGLYNLASKNDASIFAASKLYRTNQLKCAEAQKHAGGYIKTADTASKAGKKTILSFLGKSMGVLFKYVMPALFIIQPVISAIKELKNGGGILGALKELAKGAISLLGYALGGLLVTTVCGAAGWVIIPMLIVPTIIGKGVDWTAEKILGKSTEEKKQEKAQNQQNEVSNNYCGYKQPYGNLYQQRNNNFTGGNLYPQSLYNNNFAQNFSPQQFQAIMDHSKNVCNFASMLCNNNNTQMNYLS